MAESEEVIKADVAGDSETIAEEIQPDETAEVQQEVERRYTLAKETQGDSAILMDGVLWKRGAVFKTWKKRWFSMVGNTITYFDKKDGRVKGGILVETILKVRKATSSEVKQPYSFAIETTLDRTFLIYARNNDHVQDWMQCIQTAVDKYAVENPSLKPTPPPVKDTQTQEDEDTSSLTQDHLTSTTPQPQSTTSLTGDASASSVVVRTNDNEVNRLASGEIEEVATTPPPTPTPTPTSTVTPTQDGSASPTIINTTTNTTDNATTDTTDIDTTMTTTTTANTTANTATANTTTIGTPTIVETENNISAITRTESDTFPMPPMPPPTPTPATHISTKHTPTKHPLTPTKHTPTPTKHSPTKHPPTPTPPPTGEGVGQTQPQLSQVVVQDSTIVTNETTEGPLQHFKVVWEEFHQSYLEQDVETLLRYYVESSVITCVDRVTNVIKTYTGLSSVDGTDVRSFYIEFFKMLSDLTFYTTPRIEITENPNQAVMGWKCPSSNVVSGVDSIVFDQTFNVVCHNTAYTTVQPSSDEVDPFASRT